MPSNTLLEFMPDQSMKPVHIALGRFAVFQERELPFGSSLMVEYELSARPDDPTNHDTLEISPPLEQGLPADEKTKTDWD